MLGVFVLMLPLSMMNSWKLTALRLGEDRAVSFGIDVRRLRLGTLLRISMLSALAVALSSDWFYRLGCSAHCPHDFW